MNRLMLSKTSRRVIQGLITAILDQIISFPGIEANHVADSLIDVSVRIKLNYGMMDFDHFDSIIAAGERVARSHYDELKALADSLNAIRFRPMKPLLTRPLDTLEFGEIRIQGNTPDSPGVFPCLFQGCEGAPDRLTRTRNHHQLHVWFPLF